MFWDFRTDERRFDVVGPIAPAVDSTSGTIAASKMLAFHGITLQRFDDFTIDDLIASAVASALDAVHTYQSFA
jgi:hypothetical protein